MKAPLRSIVLALPVCLSVLCARAQQVPQPPLPTITLTAGIHVIQAELAGTPLQQQIGLMGRTYLSSNGGMLFVFDANSTHCMWMRNTLLPLSVAFIDENGAIANVEDMAPRTENTHCAARTVRYALEMSQGWFAKRGLKAGTTISGLPKP